MVKKTKKVGRPKLPDSEKQKYQRLAVYPHTHAKLLRLKKRAGDKYLIDYVERLVESLPED